MKLTIMDEDKVYHETDSIGDAEMAISWLIASKLSFENMIITVSTKGENNETRPRTQ